MKRLFRVLSISAVTLMLAILAWRFGSRHFATPPSLSKFDRPHEPTVDEQLDYELDLQKQKVIWTAEHLTFELETRFGRQFLSDMKGRNWTALAQHFRSDFQGDLATGFDDQQFEVAGLIELRRRPHSATESITAEQLMARLRSLVEAWPTHPLKGKLRVLSLQAHPQRAHHWSAKILLTIAGEVNDSWRELESTHEVLFFVEDEKRLGQSPCLATWTWGEEIHRTGGKPLFQSVTERHGLDRAPLPDNWLLPPEKAWQYRFQMAVGDLDGDQRWEIAVATHESSYLLVPDEDGVYRDQAAEWGISGRHALPGRPGSLATFFDIDNDGDSDLLLGNRLYRNDRGRELVDITDQSNLRFRPQGMGSIVADYDADGLLDLYILYQGTDAPTGRPRSWISDNESGAENHLWKNLGDGHFKNVTVTSRAGGGRRNSLAGCWFFFDGDHYPDLYIANDFGENVLLRNRGDGSFEDVSVLSGTTDFATTMGVSAGDLDNNGVTELYVANMYSKMGRRIIGNVCESDYPPGVFELIQGSCAGNRLYWRPDHQRKFEDRGSLFRVDAVGWAYAPAMLDVNNDGWLDLYATTGFLSFNRDKPDG